MDAEQEDEGGRATGPGLLLLLCGVMMGWMGLDLLTGGALTRAVSGGLYATADRIDGGQEESGQDGGT
jgi:hypothetical protein